MGGAEKLRLTLLRNIDRTRFQIRVCCISHKGMVGEEVEKAGFPVDELKRNPGPRYLLTTLSVVNYVRSYKPDILHTCLFNANFHGRIAGFLCGIAHIVSEVHGQYYEFVNYRSLAFLFAEHLLYKVSDNLICCSDSSKNDIINRIKLPAEKIMTISNCIDSSAYTVKEDRENIRKKLGITSEFVLITVASFWEMKGHSYLLQALSKLKQAGYMFKWVCAGDGELKESIQQMCLESRLRDDVIFLGRVNCIADYLNASDLFVLPSLSEALSIALIEAMYLGLPCVVTDVGSNRELIENNTNGIVVEPKNIDALKDAISFCFSNRSRIREFGDHNSKKAGEKYLQPCNYVNEYYKIWDYGNIKREDVDK